MKLLLLKILKIGKNRVGLNENVPTAIQNETKRMIKFNGKQ
jgi:hypothetical protein